MNDAAYLWVGGGILFCLILFILAFKEQLKKLDKKIADWFASKKHNEGEDIIPLPALKYHTRKVAGELLVEEQEFYVVGYSLDEAWQYLISMKKLSDSDKEVSE